LRPDYNAHTPGVDFSRDRCVLGVVRQYNYGTRPFREAADSSHDAERDGIDEAELGEFAFDFVEVRRDFDSWNAPDPNVIEGRVREELEKQQEELANASTSSAATRYSADNNKTGTEEEGRAERALENGEAQPSGRGGGEIEVMEKSKAF